MTSRMCTAFADAVRPCGAVHRATLLTVDFSCGAGSWRGNPFLQTSADLTSLGLFLSAGCNCCWR